MINDKKLIKNSVLPDVADFAPSGSFSTLVAGKKWWRHPTKIWLVLRPKGGGSGAICEFGGVICKMWLNFIKSLLLIKSGLRHQCLRLSGRVTICMIPFWISLLMRVVCTLVLSVWVPFDKI